MRTYRYIGTFINSEGNTYTIEVYCIGFIEAFFLLTAEAIKSARHFDLNFIVDEKGYYKSACDILSSVKECFAQS